MTDTEYEAVQDVYIKANQLCAEIKVLTDIIAKGSDADSCCVELFGPRGKTGLTFNQGIRDTAKVIELVLELATFRLNRLTAELASLEKP